MLINLPIKGQNADFKPADFRRINSGTKYDIEALQRDSSGNVYFLSHKAYRLQGESWKDLGFQAEIKINTLNPISEESIWFSGDNYKYTSDVYQFHHGEWKIVKSPLANQITCVTFFSEQEALFGGYRELASFFNGEFRVIHHMPADTSIRKIAGDGIADAWLLYKDGKLYHFNGSIFTRFEFTGAIKDFSVRDGEPDVLLTDEGLYRNGHGIPEILVEAPVFREMHKFLSIGKDQTLIIGENGKLAEFYQGRLHLHSLPYPVTLTDVMKNGNEIWISGKEGLLLYRGDRNLPEYDRVYQGFSAHKPSVYQVPFNNEYGVAMEDVNADGHYDLYTVRISEQNRLLINHLESSGQVYEVAFSEEALERRATGDLDFPDAPGRLSYQLGLAVADVDNDADQDIYLCYLSHKNRLLLNKGDGFFRNVSGQANRATTDFERSNSAVFADVDLDGDLDLFVANENSTNRLFLGDGTGFFIDVTDVSGVTSVRGGMNASFADLNQDGLPDLCVAFWHGQNKLYLNETRKGNVFFKDITRHTDLALAPPVKSNSVVFADVNNDGNLDLFVANRNDRNRLYLNSGEGVFVERTVDFFEDYDKIQMSNGAVFADFNLDGFLDLYLSNVGDSKLYMNNGGEQFVETTALYGAELYGYATGSAVGDIDDDGDPDLYVANYLGGDSKLFLNQSGKQSFVKLKFEGILSNRDGIGTKVWLLDESTQRLTGYRELIQGMGYGSCSAKEMIFGVPGGSGYRAKVKFPSSPDTIYLNGLKPGDSRRVVELGGIQGSYIRARNAVFRFFRDRELHPEFIKTAAVFFLLLITLRVFRRKSTLGGMTWLLAGLTIFGLFLWLNRYFLYQWPSFPFFIPPLILGVFLVIQALYINRFLLIRRSRLEKQSLREHLARDLHDDLASTLGSISIYSQTLSASDEEPQKQRKILDKIGYLAQKALQSTADIIWMTSPRNDSFQDLISKCSAYLTEVLEDGTVQLEQTLEIPDTRITLEETLRNNVFLIFKEAVHNMIRHSQAKEVIFSVQREERLARIMLEDNGTGFDPADGKERPEASGPGYGLSNMKKRAGESGIDLEIRSAPGKGTNIRMSFRI
jgi:signal transduction histidine kinase